MLAAPVLVGSSGGPDPATLVLWGLQLQLKRRRLTTWLLKPLTCNCSRTSVCGLELSVGCRACDAKPSLQQVVEKFACMGLRLKQSLPGCACLCHCSVTCKVRGVIACMCSKSEYSSSSSSNWPSHCTKEMCAIRVMP